MMMDDMTQLIIFAYFMVEVLWYRMVKSRQFFY